MALVWPKIMELIKLEYPCAQVTIVVPGPKLLPRVLGRVVKVNVVEVVEVVEVVVVVEGVPFCAVG